MRPYGHKIDDTHIAEAVDAQAIQLLLNDENPNCHKIAMIAVQAKAAKNGLHRGMRTPPLDLPLVTMAAVVTPALHAWEFWLTKKRHETPLPLLGKAAENSLGGKVSERTHSPSLG